MNPQNYTSFSRRADPDSMKFILLSTNDSSSKKRYLPHPNSNTGLESSERFLKVASPQLTWGGDSYLICSKKLGLGSLYKIYTLFSNNLTISIPEN